MAPCSQSLRVSIRKHFSFQKRRSLLKSKSKILVLGPVSKKYIRGKIILLSVTSNKKPYRHLLYQEEIPLLDVIRITVSCFKCYVILGSVSSFLCDYLNALLHARSRCSILVKWPRSSRSELYVNNSLNNVVGVRHHFLSLKR